MPLRDELDDIYTEHVTDHVEDPFHRGHCKQPTHMHEDENPLCGDKVHVELEIGSDGLVKDAWFDGKGCRISQASASMLMEQLEGKSIEEVKAFSANDMLSLFRAKLMPMRQKCCLLPWRVVQAALHAPIQQEPSAE